MVKKLYTEEFIQDIADAFRETNPSLSPNAKFYVDDMGPYVRNFLTWKNPNAALDEFLYGNVQAITSYYKRSSESYHPSYSYFGEYNDTIKDCTFVDAGELRNVFNNASALQSVDVYNVYNKEDTRIYRAFRNCPELTSVSVSKNNLPGPTYGIGYSFQNCPKLNWVRFFGKDLALENSFTNCGIISNIILRTETPLNIDQYSLVSAIGPDTKIYILPEMQEEYEAHLFWKQYKSQFVISDTEPLRPAVT